MPESAVPDWARLPDLASRLLGGAVIAANDEFFAAKENLVKPMVTGDKETAQPALSARDDVVTLLRAGVVLGLCGHRGDEFLKRGAGGQDNLPRPE